MRGKRHKIARPSGPKWGRSRAPIRRHPTLGPAGTAFPPHDPGRDPPPPPGHPPRLFRPIRGRLSFGSCSMPVMMPAPDADLISRREQIVAALRAIVPGEGVIATEREMRPYESDGLTAYRQLPMVVVLPSTTAQVAQVLRYCHEHG